MKDGEFEVGDRVRITYLLQPTIEAVIVDPAPESRYGGRRSAWVTVEQVTDFEDAEPGNRPRFDAWVRCVTLIG